MVNERLEQPGAERCWTPGSVSSSTKSSATASNTAIPSFLCGFGNFACMDVLLYSVQIFNLIRLLGTVSICHSHAFHMREWLLSVCQPSDFYLRVTCFLSVSLLISICESPAFCLSVSWFLSASHCFLSVSLLISICETPAFCLPVSWFTHASDCFLSASLLISTGEWLLSVCQSPDFHLRVTCFLSAKFQLFICLSSFHLSHFTSSPVSTASLPFSPANL